MLTIFRTSILATVFACTGAAVAAAQGTQAPPDPHHPAQESGAVTAPAGAPEAAGMPPAAAPADNPSSGGMMVMMTPDMMQMMMEMMADQCTMSGDRQTGPRPGHPYEQSRHRMMAGDEVGGPGARPRGPMREQTADRAPMLPLAPKLLSVQDVGRILAQHLEAYANPRLRVGTVAPAGEDTITAVIETVDGSLVERLVFDRFTGEFARADE